MIGRLPLAAAVLLALLAACAAPPPLADQAQQDPLADFTKGMWVEAKGTLEAGVPLVREIDELKRDAADKADKSELTAPVDSADATSLRMLGVELTLDDDCEYEDAEKNAITKFTPATGEWLRVKVRLKDGRLRARTLRRTETRTEFKVLHELMSARERVLSRDYLLKHVWGYQHAGDGRIVDNLVYRLRSKIEDDPASPTYLVTVRGFGYRLKA